ncbi:MAG: PLP-dependent aminotransferase family protein [Acetobacteraceae bacterium]
MPQADYRRWDDLFAASASRGRALQARIREMALTAISEGWLKAGSPLPSTRVLAERLSVARNTVLLAYQQLVDTGVLESRERSGYFVRPTAVSYRRPPTPATGSAPVAWEPLLTAHPSRQRNISKSPDWLNCRYPFIYGQFDPALFPINDWRECVRRALGVLEVRHWAPDFIDSDDPALIEQIGNRLLPRRGIWSRPDEIMVTLGAQQALYLIAELLIRKGTVVGMENPGYPDARNIFELKGARLEPLEIDASGVVPEAIPSNCDLLYLTPNRQCPTGARLPLERRRELVALANSRNLVLIEDDYESNFSISTDPVPMLRSLDQSGRVIYVGTLSKILAPGLRAGYMVAAPELVREARALRRLAMRHPPANNQRALALFIAAGCLDRLLKRVAIEIPKRAAAMRNAMAQYLPGVTYRYGEGGISFWVRGPDRLDSSLLARRAEAQGVFIEAGSIFFMDAVPPTEYFRLGFCAIRADRIEPGIRALAGVMGEFG